MKALDQHNAERRQIHDILQRAKEPPNGIACPSCGEELRDSDPSMVLTTKPPKKNVHCPACKWRGSRIA